MRTHSLLGSFGALMVGVAALLCSPSASGQDSATAEALFRKALDDMEAGRYASGCPALAESYRLDARPGTLFTLAECEAKAGMFASAVAHYGDYLALFARMPAEQRQRQQGRDAVAQQQISKLQPLIPHLVVVLPDDAPPGTIVRRDGVVLGTPSLGIPLPVDAGEHELATKAPGGPLTTTKVSVAQGETVRVQLVVAPAPPGASAEPRARGTDGPAATTREPGAAAGPQAAPARDKSGGSRVVWSYILGGLAIEGLVVGSAAGILAWDKKSVIDRECEGSACSPAGMDAADSARTFGLVSSVSFGVGAAALAGAVLLWTTTPSSDEPASKALRPVVAGDGRTGGFVGLAGGF